MFFPFKIKLLQFLYKIIWMRSYFYKRYIHHLNYIRLFSEGSVIVFWIHLFMFLFWPSSPNPALVLFSPGKFVLLINPAVFTPDWLPGKGRVENQQFLALEDRELLIPGIDGDETRLFSIMHCSLRSAMTLDIGNMLQWSFGWKRKIKGHLSHSNPIISFLRIPTFASRLCMVPKKACIRS